MDMLHLDGMLGVGLWVMQLADIHCGLLRLVGGSGLEREREPIVMGEVQEKPLQRKKCPDRYTHRQMRPKKGSEAATLENMRGQRGLERDI